MENIESRSKKMVLTMAVSAVAVVPLLLQTPAAKKPSFEVASVKPAAAVNTFDPGGPKANRFTLTGTLGYLLVYAYSLELDLTGKDNRVVGGPAWIGTDRFDITAKADDTITSLTPGQAKLMLQSLLEDRFQLKAHIETREVPVYNLVVAKGGHKMKLSEDQGPYGASGGQRGLPVDGQGPVPRGMVRITRDPSGRILTGSSARITTLLTFLRSEAGRPVYDKTNLNQLFDFAIHLPGPLTQNLPAPETATEPATSIFTAVQDLGLRLESAKGPIQVLLVESVQRPSEN